MTFKCDLDLGVATQLLRIAHHLIMVITCANLIYQQKISGLKVMENAQNYYERTDRQTDEGNAYNTPSPLCGRGLKIYVS
jgi:hypothetical protein